MAFIRLIRPLNLIIIAVIMYTLRYFVIAPAIKGYTDLGIRVDFEFVLTELDFFLLVFSTILLAASGNIINDYFDLRADRINKPEKVIVGRRVKRRIAMLAHFTMNGAGLLLGFYVAWRSGLWQLALIHIFAAGSLWFYSTSMKRQFLSGNLIISLLAAVVPAQVALFDIPPIIRQYGRDLAQDYQLSGLAVEPSDFFFAIANVCFIYAGFAFATTLVREIQKDIADIKGDRAVGCKTIPIVLGKKASKGVVVTLLLGILVLIGLMQYKYFMTLGWPVNVYIVGLVALPLVVSGALTLRANDRKAHLLASQFMKVAMVTAICIPIFF